MLIHCLKQSGAEDLVDFWQRDINNKPFIANWDMFNISHAGNVVLFCHGKDPVGIDIERKDNFNYKEMIDQFHPSEQKHILDCSDIGEFYKIWVKKEALLKAVGKGIISGLNHFSVVDSTVTYEDKKWYFHNVSIHPDYICYLCNLHESNKALPRKFFLKKQGLT